MAENAAAANAEPGAGDFEAIAEAATAAAADSAAAAAEATATEATAAVPGMSVRPQSITELPASFDHTTMRCSLHWQPEAP